jgi:signal transduction histidine kinase
MNQDEINIAIITSTLIAVILVATIIFLFLVVQNRKRKHLLEKKISEQKFEKELAKSQNEIREKALKNLSWEIHDNVGQLLSVAKMQLNRIELKSSNKNEINEVTKLVSKSLQDLRALSKSLNPIAIQQIGFIKAIQLEIDRYNRLNFINANLQIVNTPFEIEKQKETILFRIIQEFITNSLKHSKASKLEIIIIFNKDNLEIKINDNGVGFDINNESNGIGIINMQGRAKLINAELFINSKINKGTTLKIKILKNN